MRFILQYKNYPCLPLACGDHLFATVSKRVIILKITLPVYISFITPFIDQVCQLRSCIPENSKDTENIVWIQLCFESNDFLHHSNLTR